MVHNFWYWLLAGLHGLLLALLGQFPLHAPMGLVDAVTIVFTNSFSIIIFVAGSFFHLRVFAFVFSAIIGLEIVRTIIAIWRWIMSVIPVVGH